ncbi:MAG: hypothetical protein HC800_15875 [Phormidesmis sp. RL_2_1]|nr:hypothetical protein [Phormidesmis sp. RL_2_1]
MTERIEPYIVTRQDSKTGQTEIYAGDRRYAKHEISASDRKIFELYKLSVQYEYSNQPDKALECIVLACESAQTIQSRSAYAVLVGRLITFQQFDQLPALVHLGQKLKDDWTLALIAPILARLGQVDQAISLVHDPDLGEHLANTKIIALAKIAVEIANQNDSQKAYQLITQSLQVARSVRHSKNTVLAEIAVQAAHAGFYEYALEIAQEVIPAVRQTATLAKIETINFRSQSNS